MRVVAKGLTGRADFEVELNRIARVDVYFRSSWNLYRLN